MRLRREVRARGGDDPGVSGAVERPALRGCSVTNPKHGQLPPLPALPPRRSLTPPERRQSGTFDVDTDAATPRKPVELATYQSLLSVFDELAPEQRVDFVELGFLFKGLSSEDRKRLLDVAIAANGLG